MADQPPNNPKPDDKSKKSPTEPDENIPETTPAELALATIPNKDIKNELSRSYIDYAMSVIIGRAIPDVRDGLKPVHRRILYSMAENGFYSNQPHRKCARIVGDVLGRYHPHGDMAVYDALVRMAQPFSMRYTLIDGQGNFGSVDGDPAAAMRYTEARLARITNTLLDDMDKDTVDFTDNFDGSLKEPLFLPSKLPNLLLNGVSGIAVGMSTNMAPHNVNEVINAICAAIDIGPENFTPDDVLKHIHGPDFPTGGIIIGKQGIIDAIRTGRGSITIRAKAEIESDESGKGRDAIIVSEIPYMVNKTTLIENIADLVNKGAIPEISDVRDESDRKGMRIYIELKKNTDSNACLKRLFMRTQLQSKFGIINLILINQGKQPKILNYAELIKEYLQHRLQVVKRRTEFELKKAEKRLHLIEGLLIAIDHIDEVIAIIRKSVNTEEASKKLIERFAFSDIQAEEILKMPLSRLTNLQTQKLIDEKTELIQKITEFQTLLADKQKMYAVIKKELQEIAEQFGDPRRTEIQEAAEATAEIDIKETIPEESCVIMITQNQMIKKMTLDTYQSQRRGGKGKKGMQVREEDLIQDMFTASSHDTILLFTQQGRVYSIPAYKIPNAQRTAKGKAILNYVALKPGELIIDLINIKEFKENSLIFITMKGTIKKTNLDEFSNIRANGIACMNVRENDLLVRVRLCNANDHIFIPTKQGYAVHFDEKELRPIGRAAMGVRGITLRTETDEVVDLVVSTPTTRILSITKKGYGKISLLELYRLTHRGGKGVKNMKLRSADDEVIATRAIKANENLLLASSKGQLIRIRSEDVRETGRAAKGVIVMRLAEEDYITSVAICEAEEDEGEDFAKLEPITDLKDDEESEEEEDDEIPADLKAIEILPKEPLTTATQEVKESTPEKKKKSGKSSKKRASPEEDTPKTTDNSDTTKDSES